MGIWSKLRNKTYDDLIEIALKSLHNSTDSYLVKKVFSIVKGNDSCFSYFANILVLEGVCTQKGFRLILASYGEN